MTSLVIPKRWARFCDRYPDVLACQKLDEPEDPGKLKTQEVDFTSSLNPALQALHLVQIL